MECDIDKQALPCIHLWYDPRAQAEAGLACLGTPYLHVWKV